MYTNSITQNQAKIPIYSKFKKRPVGTVYPDRAVFRKVIQGSKHLLRQPPAIANDVDVLRKAQENAEWCEIEDKEDGTVYRAKIQHIFEKGTPFNRGWGDQIYLELGGWITKTKPTQLDLFAVGV